ncbi:MAG: hypothetical protein V2A73_14585 [Pseudomonadota bacterium]
MRTKRSTLVVGSAGAGLLALTAFVVGSAQGKKPATPQDSAREWIRDPTTPPASAIPVREEDRARRYSRLLSLAVDKPGGMAFDGTLLWIADRMEAKLHGGGGATGLRIPVPTIPIASGVHPQYLARA